MCKLYGHRKYFFVQIYYSWVAFRGCISVLGKGRVGSLEVLGAKQTNDKGFEDPMVLIVISVRTGFSLSVCQNK